MQQKICSRCGALLDRNERALDMIQCAKCYTRWVSDVARPAEPLIHAMVDRLREESSKHTS